MSPVRAVITFKSAVHALMGEEAIAAAGLRVGVMSRPMELGADCGFCLRVGTEDLDRALAVLASAGLAWQGAYHDNKGGDPRFVSAGSSPDVALGSNPLAGHGSATASNGPQDSSGPSASPEGSHLQNAAPSDDSGAGKGD